MKHVMVCISGFSGTGKDEIAKRLWSKHNATQANLVDPAKRHVMDLYGFTEDQVFGPSESRNSGDDRYVRSDGTLLTPREALQKYCALMQDMYECTWVSKAVYVHHKIASGEYTYSRVTGLIKLSGYQLPSKDVVITCASDFRHKHEMNYVRGIDFLTPVILRVKRPEIEEPPYDHRSETEQATIPDSAFDAVINNDSTINDLGFAVDEIISAVLSGVIVPSRERV